jgi:hypothetical protein
MLIPALVYKRALGGLKLAICVSSEKMVDAAGTEIGRHNVDDAIDYDGRGKGGGRGDS